MKNTIIVLLIFIFSSLVYGQSEQQKEEEDTSTELSKFMSKTGQIFIKNLYSAGKLKGSYGTSIEVDAMVLSTPGDKSETRYGLSIKIYGGNKKNAATYFDYDEVQSVIDAFIYMKNILVNKKGIIEEQTEIIYKTRGSFTMGIYNSDNEINLYASINKYPTPTLFAEAADITGLINIFEKGYKILNDKKL